MQRALLAALLTGLIAPAIGTYIVQRRLSLLGDGLGHVAIAGVGLALLTGQAPVPVAVVVCVAGAVAVELLRQRGKATGDVGLAILFYGGLAAGVLMSGIAGQGAGGAAPVPVRLADHGRLPAIWSWSPCSRWSSWCRRSAWLRSCSRSARTRSSPAPRGCGPASYNVLIVVLAADHRRRWPCGRSGCCWSAPDGGPGGGRAQPGPRLLRRPGRRDGRRGHGLGRRRRRLVLRSTPRPAR